MKRAFAASILILACTVVRAQNPPALQLGERVDVIAKKALARPVAGISIAVARDGRIVFARGYGLANIEHAVAVTPKTVFHIASISKNILAAVVLKLADEGKLRLDDDVTKYVPEAPTHGRPVTVRQLLNSVHHCAARPRVFEFTAEHRSRSFILRKTLRKTVLTSFPFGDNVRSLPAALVGFFLLSLHPCDLLNVAPSAGTS